MSTQKHERIPQFTLGDRLRKARTLTGLTVAEFAETIGVSDRTINNAEGDKRAVRQITLNAWALATGVPVDWLETGHHPEGPGDPGNAGPHHSTELERLAAKKRRRTRGTAATDQYLPTAC